MKKKIFTRINGLTDVEKYVIEKMNIRPEVVLGFDIKIISQEFNTSISTLSRLSKKMGFTKFSDLRLYISNEIGKISNYSAIDDDSKIENVTKDVLTFSRYSLTETLKNPSKIEIIENFCATIEVKDSVVIYGIESSYLAAKELAINLQRLGIDAISTEIFDTCVTLMFAKKNARVIIFSDSMRSKRTLAIHDLMDEKQGLIITSNKEIIGENVFHFESLRINFEKSELSAKYAQLAIADILFLYTAKKHTYKSLNNKVKEILKKF